MKIGWDCINILWCLFWLCQGRSLCNLASLESLANSSEEMRKENGIIKGLFAESSNNLQLFTQTLPGLCGKYCQGNKKLFSQYREIMIFIIIKTV